MEGLFRTLSLNRVLMAVNESRYVAFVLSALSVAFYPQAVILRTIPASSLAVSDGHEIILRLVACAQCDDRP